MFYLILTQRHQQVGEKKRFTLSKMATHKGHFRWHNEEEVYGKAQWTRVYFVLKTEERALYIYKQKKVRFPPLPLRNEEAKPFSGCHNNQFFFRYSILVEIVFSKNALMFARTFVSSVGPAAGPVQGVEEDRRLQGLVRERPPQAPEGPFTLPLSSFLARPIHLDLLV